MICRHFSNVRDTRDDLGGSGTVKGPGRYLLDVYGRWSKLQNAAVSQHSRWMSTDVWQFVLVGRKRHIQRNMLLLKIIRDTLTVQITARGDHRLIWRCTESIRPRARSYPGWSGAAKTSEEQMIWKISDGMPTRLQQPPLLPFEDHEGQKDHGVPGSFFWTNTIVAKSSCALSEA